MITHRIVAYLISLAVGYWVLTLAAKEKGINQKAGKIIGWIIIAVSLIGPLCIATCHICCRSSAACCYSDGCHWGAPGSMACPMEKGGGMMGKDGGMTGGTDKGKEEKAK